MSSDQSQSRLFKIQDNTLVVVQDLISDAASDNEDQSPEGQTTTGMAAAAHSSRPITAGIWQPGTVVDKKFRILGLIGQGGMGAVYKAHHEFLAKNIALKTFKTANYSKAAWKQFQNEAKLLASLNDKHIVQIYDFGFAEDNIPYYTMELLSGEALDEKLEAEGALKFEATIDIFIQVCRGLTTAHRKGILHRDIKPANIFLENAPASSGSSRRNDRASGGNYTVKLLDFGIASFVAGETEQGRSEQQTRELRKKQDESTGSGTGTCFGSPLYMSPEQARGDKLTPATDVYSCGCALYELLTGEPPFLGATIFETLLKHQQEHPPAISSKFVHNTVPARLDKLIEKMLAKSPQDRFQSITEVESELVAIRNSSAPTSQGTRPLDQNQTSGRNYNRRPGPGIIFIVATTTVISAAIMTGIYVSLVKPLSNKEIAIKDRPFVYSLPTEMERQKSKAATMRSTNSSAKATSNLADNTANTQPQTTLTVDKFLVDSPADRKNGIKRFRFPSLLFRSELRTPESGIPGLPAKTHGEVTVPAGTTLCLYADSDLAEHPELFLGFGPNDFYQLRLEELKGAKVLLDLNWDDSQMPYISKLSGISLFETRRAAFTERSLAYFDNFTSLTSLHMRYSEHSVSWLAKLKRLPELTSLALPRSTGTAPLCKALARQSKLRLLHLESCQVDRAQVEDIVKIKSLNHLMLPNNPKVDDSCIEPLQGLPLLENLELEGTGITATAVPLICKLHRLRRLKISANLLSQAEINTIRKSFGKGFVLELV